MIGRRDEFGNPDERGVRLRGSSTCDCAPTLSFASHSYLGHDICMLLQTTRMSDHSRLELGLVLGGLSDPWCKMSEILAKGK